VMINLSGSDPELISTTINTVADKFVERNVSFRKRKTTELMKALEKQLEAAHAQVLRDENRVRIFRENNPKVGLGVDAQSAVTNISMMEAKTIGIQNEIEEAEKLLHRLAEASADQEQITSEALLYLGSQNVTGAIILNQEHNSLLQQKAAYLAKNYSPEHPLVKEVKEKIDAVRVKTMPQIEEYIKKLKKEIANTKTQQTVTLNQLQGLPQQEMQLATLMRQQQINSEIYSNILSKFNQATITDETEVSNIYIMDYSVPPEETSAKKELLKLVAIGLLVCVLISFGPAIAIDLFDKRARCEEDLKRFLHYPLLETVPLFAIDEKADIPIDKPNPKLVTASTDLTYIQELFRSLRTKLNYRLELVYGRSFLISSLDASEGKSLIASNVAIMAAQQHVPTLLIDGDMRRGTLNSTFKIGNPPGLSDLLTCENQINEQMLRYTIRQTEFKNLFLLSAGSPIQNPAEALTRTRFKAIINWALTKFRMIIIDAPPVSPVTDAIIMSNLISGSIFVVRAGKSNTAELNKIIEEYPDLKSKILGVILNGVKDNNKRKKYNAYYYKSNPLFNAQPLLLTHNESDKKQKS
ncbi:MAG: polysaccharide biosynthesis tyrosine autokinase, partial [Fibrobacter sp.]|nr:polysaccharide biosynthesis tyrosine autokinase [Fibrobacter sp.]